LNAAAIDSRQAVSGETRCADGRKPDALPGAPQGLTEASAQRGFLPCLKRNNGDKEEKGALSEAEKIASNPPPSGAKTAYALTENVRSLCERYGIEKIGFLTLTFPDNVQSIEEAQRRFHNLQRRVLRDMFPVRIMVKERQKRGAWHYHLLVVCSGDIQTGFDFGAFAAWAQLSEAFKKLSAAGCEPPEETVTTCNSIEREYIRSASPLLRDYWRTLRESLPAYGFGRHELMPVKSGAEVIGKYVGKYIRKHITNRKPEDKGARLVSYTKGAKTATTRFSWVGGRAALWRAGMAKICPAIALEMRRASVDEDFFKTKGGDHWAYTILPVVVLVGEGTLCTADGVRLCLEFLRIRG
jgi:hypothetical protein